MRIPRKLDTDRLIIRRYTEDDLEGLHQFLNNRDVIGLTDMPSNMSMKETEAFLLMLIDSYTTEEPVAAMAICLKESGKSDRFLRDLLLLISQMIHRYIMHLNLSSGTTDLQPRPWRNSLNIWCLFWILTGSAIYCHPENTASINLAKRIGMQWQSIVQKKTRDTHYFLLTRENYLSGNKV